MQILASFFNHKHSRTVLSAAAAMVFLSPVHAQVSLEEAATREKAKQAEASNATPAELAFLRVSEVKDKSIALQTSAWDFHPVDGDGPTITLIAVAHIGERQFYRSLQNTLDQFDIVLYESVTPPGINVDAGDDVNLQREVTEAEMQFVGNMLKGYHDQVGVYPNDLAELRQFAVKRDSRAGHFVDLAMTDAWGHPLAYTQERDGRAFKLVSRGRDGTPGGAGMDADVSFHALPTSPWLGSGEEDNIQGQLAKALGLDFQLDAIQYDRDNWRVSDMPIDQVENELAARGSQFSVGGTLAGSGLSGQIAKVFLNVMRLADAFLDGMIADMMKVMMIELLGNEELVDTALAEFDEAMSEVIVDLRNQVVVDDMQKLLAEGGDTKTVGVFYGAAHMGDLAERMKDQMGYVPAADAAEWFTAIEVDLEQSQVSPADLRQMRMMMRMALAQQRRR